MDTKERTKRHRPEFTRITALVREDTRDGLQALADERNDGMISREIRRGLERYVAEEQAEEATA